MLLHSIKTQLHARFLLFDLGKVHHLLSLQVTRDIDRGWLRVTEALHIKQKLAEFEFLDSKPVSTPLAPGTHLITKDCPSTPIDKLLYVDFPYATIVGSLNWASLCTRSDISFSISVLAQYMHNLGQVHIRACGFRNYAGLPLRGQRTHTNAKTCRKVRNVSSNQRS